jgi:hypothetical protein
MNHDSPSCILMKSLKNPNLNLIAHTSHCLLTLPGGWRCRHVAPCGRTTRHMHGGDQHIPTTRKWLQPQQPIPQQPPELQGKSETWSPHLTTPPQKRHCTLLHCCTSLCVFVGQLYLVAIYGLEGINDSFTSTSTLSVIETSSGLLPP